MRNTGLSTSIGLIAVGAILAWAVTLETEAIDIPTVGYILFGVGILGIVVTLAADASARRTVVHHNREVVVSNSTEPPIQVQQTPQTQIQQTADEREEHQRTDDQLQRGQKPGLQHSHQTDEPGAVTGNGRHQPAEQGGGDNK